MTMQGTGGRPALPLPPPVPGKEPGAMTMQGLGPVVRRKTATPPALPAVVQAPRQHTTTAPRSMPVAAPFHSGVMPVAPPLGSGSSSSLPAAVEPVAVEAPNRAWFEQAREKIDQPAPQGEAWVGTLQLHRGPSWKKLATKLIAPTIIFTLLGALVGGFIAFELRDGKSGPAANPAPAPAQAAAVPAVPATVPAARAVAPTPAAAAFVDVLLLSTPSGATVTLVDRGKTSFIGTTPISIALDRSRTYELVFSHPSQQTWVEPLDPSKTNRVNVTLGGGSSEPAPSPAVRASEPAREAPAAAPAPAPVQPAPVAAPRPRPEAKKVERAAAEAAVAAPAIAAPTGEGILMISSKPPCEIVIDGKATGLTTPQREIALPAGSHQVTLINKAESVHKTLSVQITAGQPTKVIQDLMK
jgi:hypothetical protein